MRLAKREDTGGIVLENSGLVFLYLDVLWARKVT